MRSAPDSAQAFRRFLRAAKRSRAAALEQAAAIQALDLQTAAEARAAITRYEEASRAFRLAEDSYSTALEERSRFLEAERALWETQARQHLEALTQRAIATLAPSEVARVLQNLGALSIAGRFVFPCSYENGAVLVHFDPAFEVPLTSSSQWDLFRDFDGAKQSGLSSHSSLNSCHRMDPQKIDFSTSSLLSVVAASPIDRSLAAMQINGALHVVDHWHHRLKEQDLEDILQRFHRRFRAPLEFFFTAPREALSFAVRFNEHFLAGGSRGYVLPPQTMLHLIEQNLCPPVALGVAPCSWESFQAFTASLNATLREPRCARVHEHFTRTPVPQFDPEWLLHTIIRDCPLLGFSNAWLRPLSFLSTTLRSTFLSKGEPSPVCHSSDGSRTNWLTSFLNRDFDIPASCWLQWETYRSIPPYPIVILDPTQISRYYSDLAHDYVTKTQDTQLSRLRSADYSLSDLPSYPTEASLPSSPRRPKPPIEPNPPTFFSFPGNWEALPWRAHLELLSSKWREPALLLGAHSETELPVSVPFRQFESEGNLYVSGAPGTGKTARVLLPIGLQCIQNGRPLIVLTAKPDPAFRSTLRAEALQNGVPYFEIQTHARFRTAHVDIFQTLRQCGGDADSLTKALMEAFSIAPPNADASSDHFFASECAAAVSDAFEANPEISSFSELDAALSRVRSSRGSSTFRREKQRHSQFVQNVVQNLARVYPMLAPSTSDERSLDILDLLSSNGVLYVESNAEQRTYARQAALLLLITVIEACWHRSHEHPEDPRHPFIIIDELLFFASYALGERLNTARSAGVTAVLSNQSPAQLESHSPGLAETILSTTIVDIHLTAQTPRDISFIELTSPKVKELLYTAGISESESSNVGVSASHTDTHAVTTQESTSTQVSETITRHGRVHSVSVNYNSPTFDCPRGTYSTGFSTRGPSVDRATTTAEVATEAVSEHHGTADQKAVTTGKGAEKSASATAQEQLRPQVDSREITAVNALPGRAVFHLKRDPDALGPFIGQLFHAQSQEEFDLAKACSWPLSEPPSVDAARREPPESTADAKELSLRLLRLYEELTSQELCDA